MAPGRRSLLRDDVLVVLQIFEYRFYVCLKWVRIGRFVDKVLQVICSLLILRLVAGPVECETCAQIRIWIVGLLSQDFLELPKCLVTLARVQKHLSSVHLSFGFLGWIGFRANIFLIGRKAGVCLRRVNFTYKQSHRFGARGQCGQFPVVLRGLSRRIGRRFFFLQQLNGFRGVLGGLTKILLCKIKCRCF